MNSDCAKTGFFNITAFERANCVVFKKLYLYHYRKVVLGGSLTQQKECDVFEREKLFYQVLKNDINNKKLDKSYMNALNNRMVISLIECGILIVNSKINITSNIKSILESEEYSEACKNFNLKYLPIHWKIFFIFAKKHFSYGVIILLKIIVKLSNRM